MSMKAKYLYWDFLFGERGGLVRVTIGYCYSDRNSILEEKQMKEYIKRIS